MNIWKMLTSRVGAVNKTALISTSVVVGIVGLNVYHYATTRPAAQEAKVRSLASIINSGGSLPREYSGISLSTGGAQFASAEERARYEGRIFDGGEGTLAHLNGNFVKGKVFGGGEAGLGMGENRAALLQGNAGGAGNGADGTSQAAAAAAAALQRAGQKAAGEGGLNGSNGQGAFRSASMARASGHNLGEGGSGGFGLARQEGQNRVGASSISGAMPDGKTLLTVDARLQGARKATYMPGSREATAGYGANSSEGKGLRDIAIRSGKVAANKDRTANEGADPFFSKQQLAGGLDVSGDMNFDPELQGIGDDSFGDKMDMDLSKLDAKLDEIDTTEQEKSALRHNLIQQAVAMFFATIAAMIAIACLKNEAPYGTIAAGVITAAMLAWFVVFGVQIGKYVKLAKEFDVASGVLSGIGALCAIGIGVAWINGVASWIKGAVTKVATGLGLKEFSAVAFGASQGMGAAGKAGTQVVKEAMSDTSEGGNAQ